MKAEQIVQHSGKLESNNQIAILEKIVEQCDGELKINETPADDSKHIANSDDESWTLSQNCK